MKNCGDKLSLLLLAFIFILGLSACGGGSGGDTSASPINLWTWMSGSDVVNQFGVYGTKGTADAANIPGARSGSVSWTDSSGSLWLFGGSGYDSIGATGWLNDLWKYDGIDWTWMSGTNTKNQLAVYAGATAADNIPGARKGVVSWIDSSGNFWLFGGSGFDSTGVGLLNDLWKFDGTNWIWVSGSNVRSQPGVYDSATAADNVPGARQYAISWADSNGNFWLFGGYGYDSTGTAGYLNDLWKYDGANWIWVSGGKLVDQPGVYNSATAANNVPGARGYGNGWTDDSGNLWLFGGLGYDSTGTTLGLLNDLWKYDGTNWIWVSGSDVIDQPGVYGSQGVAASTNVPGARYSGVSWKDSSGHLWLFGGDTGDGGPLLNDLWKYDGSNWIWVSGSNLFDQTGDYGTPGATLNTNVPGARAYSASWMDNSGNFWLFGGYGIDSTGTANYLNDLWRYQP